jgi:hypothetical protein
MSTQCFREDELLDALRRGYIGDELTAHVDACQNCSELRVVAAELLDDRGHAIASAPIPSAGTMWWRMQMRRRQELESSSRRALLVGQAMTLAIALALVAALFGTDVAAGMREVIASIRLSTPLLIGIATWLLVAPIGGYVALRQK